MFRIHMKQYLNSKHSYCKDVRRKIYHIERNTIQNYYYLQTIIKKYTFMSITLFKYISYIISSYLWHHTIHW